MLVGKTDHSVYDMVPNGMSRVNTSPDIKHITSSGRFLTNGR